MKVFEIILVTKWNELMRLQVDRRHGKFRPFNRAYQLVFRFMNLSEKKEAAMMKRYERIAKDTAILIRNRYVRFLQIARETVWGDAGLNSLYLEKIIKEPDIIEKSVYEKVLQILQDRDKHVKYYKKYFFLRSKNIVEITNDASSDFFDNLLEGSSVAYFFPMDETYKINIKQGSVHRVEN